MITELTGINDHLSKGINTYSLAEDYLGSEARGKIKDKFGRLKDKLSNLGESAKNKVKGLSWREMNLGDIADTGVSTAKTFFSKGLSAAKSAAQSASTLIGGVVKPALATAKTAAVEGTQKVADYFGDVYVAGETEPRLTRGQLKAGLYFDKASGKVLTSLKDLKGAVVDKDGNILLSVDELKDSYVKGTRMMALKEALSTAGVTLKTLTGVATRALGGFYGGALTLGIAALKTAVKLLPPYDVYIAGQKEPILYAHKFKTGDQYFSKKTGNGLIHPRDIDGPVVGSDGNYIVTDDDIKAGLVDKNGIAVGNKIGRLIGKVKGLAKGALGVLKGVMGNAKELLVGIGQAFKDMFGGIFGLKGEYLETSKKQLDIQTLIYHLLLDRIPAKKHVLGDENGDGIREGSAEDIWNKEALAKKELSSNPKSDNSADSANPKKGMLASLAGLLSRKKAEDKDEDKDKDGYGLTDQLEADAAEGVGKRALGWAKKKGVKGLARFGGKALGLAGAAYGAYSAYDNIKQGNYGDAAIDATGALAGAAVTAGGVSALGSTAAAIGGGLLTGAGAIGTGLAAAGGVAATAAGGLLAVITAPVTLTALGVAAAGAAAYYGYKYLTRTKLSTLSTVRYAQYGFASSDTTHLPIVFGLEDKLLPNVKIDGEKAVITGDKIDLKALAKDFNVTMTGENGRNWAAWFSQRFKPVFLAHQAVLQSIKPGLKIGDVDDKLTPQEKLNYLEASSMPDGPFDELTSPFPDLANLTIAKDGVLSAIEIAKSDIQTQLKNDKTGTPKAVVAGAAAAAGGALSEGAKTALGTAATASDNMTPDQKLALAGMSGIVPTAETTQSDSAGSNLTVSNTVPSDFLFTGQEGRLDALTSIRFKTYGLTEMDMPKVKTLRYLEVYVAKSLKFTNNGSVYEEDVESLLNNVKGIFGVSGPNSPRGLDWMTWFKNRFLPVFLNYTTMVSKLTGKKDALVSGEMILTPQQQLDTANALYTTSAVIDGTRTSVWKVTQSPWLDYPLNTDEDTVKLNLQFLTEAIKAVKLNEQMSAKVQKQQQTDQAKGSATVAANTPGSAAPPDQAAGAPKATNKQERNYVQQNGYTESAPMTADGRGVRAIGDFKGGAVVQHPGKGTGGDINAIPVPAGDGWEAMKDMFVAVSKMTGVDLKTLASTAAIESNFNASAVPRNKQTGQLMSSAVGLFQFTAGTWANMLNKYGAKYGLAPGTPPTDPRANALMGAEFVKENISTLQKNLKKDITQTDVYMAHFLGAGGATKFLNSDPTAIAEDVMPEAAKANFNIFHDKSRNNAPRTFGEIYSLFNQKVDVETKKYNIQDTGATAVASTDLNAKSSIDTASSGATPATPPKAGQPITPDANTTASAAPPATPKPANTSTTDAATGAQTLVNSTTNAGTAAGTSSSSGYGSSVAAVTTAATPPADPTASFSTPDPIVIPPPPIVVRSAPNYTGFNANLAPSADELAAQKAQSAASMGGDVKSIAQTLLSSLDIQTKSLGTLNAMLAAIAKQGPSTVASSNTTVAANNPTTTNTPPIPRKAQTAPVSMDRMY